jgi:glutamate synthase (NADPH/NADH)
MAERLEERPFDWRPAAQGLYDPKQEKDSCGVGMVADMSGEPTRQTIDQAIAILNNLDHRGARGCEGNTGDGAGVLCSMPDKFFRRVMEEQGMTLPPLRQYAIGNVFFPMEYRHRYDTKRIFAEYTEGIEGVRFLGWRPVPVCSDDLGATAKQFEPYIEQVVLVAEGKAAEDYKVFEVALYLLRRLASKVITKRFKQPFYICSLSCRVINYKGMLTCDQLASYFPDLMAEDFEAHVAVVHSRFSTNTFPSWPRAHPYRYLAHNGEINTIKGNTNWMKAREELISSPNIPRLKELFPLFNDDQTDSSQLDNIMEVIHLGGRSLAEVALLMVPQAWEKTPNLPEGYRDFYHVQASVMEPWDGPAALVFTDSDTACACLDRNGLRPCRYYITKDKRLICSSEAGVLPDIPPQQIAKKGRLRPGEMLSVDFVQQRIMFDEEIKRAMVDAQPFGEWIRKGGFTLADLIRHAKRPARQQVAGGHESLRSLKVAGGLQSEVRLGEPSDQGLRAFGYSQESLEMILLPMAKSGADALGSMGNDTPLACLSDISRPVYDFFYQRFAQVSNPPIDPIRESFVMSLSSWIGPEQNLLAPLSAVHCQRLWLEHPCLLPDDMDAMYRVNGFRGWRSHAVDTTFPVCEGTSGMYRHLVRVCDEVCDVVRFGGVQLVVLSDRAVSRERAPLPALLCLGAVHQSMVREKLRLRAGLVVDSGEPHEVNHHCLLITFGADAVCPYNAYEAILKLSAEGQLNGEDGQPRDDKELYKNYQKAIGFGILKVIAKMGVSTVQSYKGAQIAEPIGLGEEVTSLCFTGSVSQVGGLSFVEISRNTLRMHARGYPMHLQPIDQFAQALNSDGKYHYRQQEGSETHMNDPMQIARLQEAARMNSRKAFDAFSAIHNGLVRKSTLRGQLEFRDPVEYSMTAIPIEEVEPVANILKRFRTGAMSYGSISMESHATLAIAMNRIGGKSNTGEGGEDPTRFEQMPDGDSANSAIKQVASGRFGVTIEYLTRAIELQIKMAQGAKPGEGGELPGHKVNQKIAESRKSTPGVGLVSPPPHHDIYSIEDLAQLIYDLKSANPEASVSVKLVSELGVGVVASGVAKCKADHILISGCDGGTGASKWTGIKSAGAPWELGLVEAHQTLVLNGLRGRVSLETDGNLRTGRDVMMAALLGAEQFGFATAPLIAMGCIMMRKCHLNTCPVGIATQDPVLRQKFQGLPEHVTNYLMLVAEEVRTLMAQQGFRSMDEVIGRAEVLTVNPSQFRKKSLELTRLLTPAHWLPDAGKIGNVENRKMFEQDHTDPFRSLTWEMLMEGCKETVESGSPSYFEYKPIRNLDRTVGTTFSHKLFKIWGDSLPAGTCHVKLFGTAGQSFGAFTGKGLMLELEGDSQDYFAKGLSGGLAVVYPPKEALETGFKAEENVIIGNVALYGATSGSAFVRGICCERFGVRNSGAWAVVEGAGDHCCEYMTGGRIAVLGKTGSNFASGMSGGVAWVWDPENSFEGRFAEASVELTRMDAGKPHEAYPHDMDDLKELLEAHLRFTKSTVAGGLLERWPASLPEFVRVFPNDFLNALRKSDKGAAGTAAFRSWMPAPGTTREPPKRRDEEVKPGFKFPTVDIEDIGVLVKGNRPKAADPAGLPKNDGFVKYDRAEIMKRKVDTRALDFEEIYDHKDDGKVRTQAARCMDCGTPFCHQSVTERSGCPLGNLIPEWNALVRDGKWHEAFLRLKQTNNFPEFTGRVCPAPCEASCTLGIIDDPVSIKSVELAIIDKAYEMGWMTPMPPPSRTGRTVAIIGSGPSGMAAADELNKMGHLVTVFERADRVGGLMMYGVPNMKADKAEVVERRVGIMEKEGVTWVTGEEGHIGGKFGPTAEELLEAHTAVLLCTGATVPRDLAQVPGRALQGVHMAMQYLTGSTMGLLSSQGKVDSSWRQDWAKELDEGVTTPIDAKGKKVIVIGGGDTGNDCIGTAVRQGAVSVTNLELLPQPPNERRPTNPWPHWPVVLREDYGHQEAAQVLNDGKDIRIFSVSTKEFIGDASGKLTGIRIVDLEWKHEDGRMKMQEVAGSERVLEADLVFLALGFLGGENPIAEMFEVKMERGNYAASYGRNAGRDFRTSNPKVFAAGDCRRGQSLVVWAIDEGRKAAKSLHEHLMSVEPVEKKEARIHRVPSW